MKEKCLLLVFSITDFYFEGLNQPLVLKFSWILKVKFNFCVTIFVFRLKSSKKRSVV